MDEVVGQVDFQRRQRRIWVPTKFFTDDCRTFIIGTPSLDNPRVEIDDPVLGDVFVLQDNPLLDAISPSR